MEDNVFRRCVNSIINSDKPGYGFVNDFVHCLLSNDHQLTGISNIAVVWSYELGKDNIIEPEYFFPSNKLSLGGCYKNDIGFVSAKRI